MSQTETESFKQLLQIKNNEDNQRKRNSLKSLKILGVKHSKFLSYPDNALDKIPLIKITKEIEFQEVVNDFSESDFEGKSTKEILEFIESQMTKLSYKESLQRLNILKTLVDKNLEKDKWTIIEEWNDISKTIKLIEETHEKYKTDFIMFSFFECLLCTKR